MERYSSYNFLCLVFIPEKKGRYFFARTSFVIILLLFPFLFIAAQNPRTSQSLNKGWRTIATSNDSLFYASPVKAKGVDLSWKKVNVPHNWDSYEGYRRLLHGNRHGEAWYKKSIVIRQAKGKRYFLFFEGVGSYATVYVNGKEVGSHFGGRTSFTLDITPFLALKISEYEITVRAWHPSFIKDLPWVCGGCSDERGFSEGSQPMGIFRPVHLVITNDIRVEPFGVHAWADIKEGQIDLFVNTTIKNYSGFLKKVKVEHLLVDALGNSVASFNSNGNFKPNDLTVLEGKLRMNVPLFFLQLWSPENPYLYKIISTVKVNNVVVDKVETDFGFRTISWKNPTHQFILNDKPLFINGVAEYEHLLGASHAFSNEQVASRIQWLQMAGFNALRDGHQPHNLLYGKLCNEKGILWWTQLSAHVWYDTPVFRENFKTLLREWVIERRNDPAVILWGLQNESKLPKEFAEECTALIRSLDPTASKQRLVTTCNGGEGTDWDIPQNWTGTYGGNPASYAQDLKKQVLVGEYGAWRSIDLHSDSTLSSSVNTEDRMVQLMEQKVQLAETVKDSVAGHFFWLLSSHDNPGRVQGGEGLRELDRMGPVNYKGMLTPWEEPTDVFYMYRSHYTSPDREPMVYIISHTWPNRWISPGNKDSISVYSNCDEVELFNDIDGSSFGKKKKTGNQTRFTWTNVNVSYNVLYATGYVKGKIAAKDTIVLLNLPPSPHKKKLFTKQEILSNAHNDYRYIYRINCGGGAYTDQFGAIWSADRGVSSSWTSEFKGLPSYFASQRRSFSPVKGTSNWNLFRQFRYGREKLQYQFPLPDGEYLVELYFMEPWLGIGGGMNARGMRVFDVAINGKVVLDDLDIWKEAGTNTVLKKSVKVRVSNKTLQINFPEIKSGQAIISAIAISTTNKSAIIPRIPSPAGEIKGDGYILKSWMDIGDAVFSDDRITIHSLPPVLYGADWFQSARKKPADEMSFLPAIASDIFIAIPLTSVLPSWMKEFEKTDQTMITTENNGRSYIVYRKRFAANSRITIHHPEELIIAFLPVNNMQPAFDLKKIAAYRMAVAIVSQGVAKESFNGRDVATVKTPELNTIEWPVQTGVADIYSVTVKYYYNNLVPLKGKWQLLNNEGTIMQEEAVEFTFTREGKWNQFTISTSTMINAGNYRIKLIIAGGNGLSVSGIDIQ